MCVVMSVRGRLACEWMMMTSTLCVLAIESGGGLEWLSVVAGSVSFALLQLTSWTARGRAMTRARSWYLFTMAQELIWVVYFVVSGSLATAWSCAALMLYPVWARHIGEEELHVMEMARAPFPQGGVAVWVFASVVFTLAALPGGPVELCAAAACVLGFRQLQLTQVLMEESSREGGRVWFYWLNETKALLYLTYFVCTERWVVVCFCLALMCYPRWARRRASTSHMFSAVNRSHRLTAITTDRLRRAPDDDAVDVERRVDEVEARRWSV